MLYLPYTVVLRALPPYTDRTPLRTPWYTVRPPTAIPPYTVVHRSPTDSRTPSVHRGTQFHTDSCSPPYTVWYSWTLAAF